MSRSVLLPSTLLALLAFGLGAPRAVLADGETSAESGGATADTKGEKPETKPEKEAPKTVEPTRGPFTVLLEASAGFSPRDPVEVRYEPEQYGGALEVVEAVGAGPVVKGQVLVRFATKEIDRQLEAVQADLAIARAVAAKQEEESKRQEEATTVALKQGELEKRRADENLKQFLEVWLPMRKEEARMGISRMEHSLADQTEELQQLEKMYSGDDLTEETEEIVLRRTRRELERFKRAFDLQKQRHAMLMDVELPREEENHVLAQRREANEWDRLQATARLGLDQARLELAKARLNLRRQEENHDRLKDDREALVVKAPESGVAVPGAFSDGKWQGLDETTKALQPGRKAPAKQVLYTIVRPGALGATLSVDEATVMKVHEGQTGTAVPTALPDLTLPVRIARVARFSPDGKFRVDLTLASSDERLMPGYGAKVKIELETKANALTVPQAAVAKDGDKTFVHVWREGKSTPKAVKTGATSDGRTEIVDGLAGDERILEKAPKS